MSRSVGKERVIAYIDGFNVYYGLRTMARLRNRKKRWPNYYWLDYQSLARRVLRPSQSLVETKFFSALVPDAETRRRQKMFLEALGTLDDSKTILGYFRGNEEKMTDVNIALEMVCDAYEDRFDMALVLSGDSDLVPAILRVKARFPEKRVVAAFVPSRKSTRIAEVADGHIIISRPKFAQSQFPDRVTTSDGSILDRPYEWR